MMKIFKHKPYLRDNILNEHKNELLHIEQEIAKQLSEFENFDGIDFCDVNAGGIQIRGHHKQINGYTYGKQSTIKYDFSNYLECIDEFVQMWKEYDTPKNIKDEQWFIEQGEKYGWD